MSAPQVWAVEGRVWIRWGPGPPYFLIKADGTHDRTFNTIGGVRLMPLDSPPVVARCQEWFDRGHEVGYVAGFEAGRIEGAAGITRPGQPLPRRIA